jgi:uncharacterized protein with von Willebrand factor type A (vWA) domain
MALWQMERTGDEITLTYTDHPGSAAAVVQRCGASSVALRSDVEAWVFDEAAPWDLCRTVDGAVVVRQASASDALPPRASLEPVVATVTC